jgi:HPt (histidine-containing phosphotransfer) domain-containing protein
VALAAGEVVGLFVISPACAQADMQASEPIDFLALTEMMGGNEALVGTLLTTFLREMTTDLAALQQALADSDQETVRRLAHRQKGTAANLQAVMYSAAARELEQASVEGEIGLTVIKYRVLSEHAERLREQIQNWLQRHPV